MDAKDGFLFWLQHLSGLLEVLQNSSGALLLGIYFLKFSFSPEKKTPVAVVLNLHLICIFKGLTK